MNESPVRNSFQFRPGTLIAVVLVVASFLAGRLSQLPVLKQLRSENVTIRRQQQEAKEKARRVEERARAQLRHSTPPRPSTVPPVRHERKGQTQGRIKIDPSSNLEKLSDNERRAVEAAKASLEEIVTETCEVVFTVTRKGDGYDVFVEYVAGRDDNGSPRFYFGGHALVIVSGSFEVVKIVGGA